MIVPSGSVDKPRKVVSVDDRRCFLFVLLIKLVFLLISLLKMFLVDSVNKSSKIFPGGLLINPIKLKYGGFC